MPGPYDRRGNVGCELYAFSLTTTLSPKWMGKDGVSVVVMIPNLLMPVSHPGDLSLNVPHINMIKCNSSDTEAYHACQAANKRLQRTYPSSSCKVNRLLRRNYWIIKKADTVHTFGKFAQNSQGLEWDVVGRRDGTPDAQALVSVLYDA